MPQQKTQEKNIMYAIAATIVRSRFVIILLFLAAAVYCALSVGRVRVNSDLTFFLSPETETRQGLTIMEEEFTAYAGEDLMIANITYERARALADEIAAMDMVFSVGFDDTPSHYTRASALLSVSFKGTGNDQRVKDAKQEISELLAPYDTYTYSGSLDNYFQQLAREMVGVVLIAAAVIVAILLFTSRSYFEVVIFMIVFVFAALLNMGTNFWLGEISSITNSIAIILQLALAIDYAIIFSHRYQDEALVHDTYKEALIVALAKSILEISSSSLTTISGLVALMLMQFRLGYDLGMVLAKGIVCSLLTVFLLMPGLIMLFPKAIRRTAHKSLIPDIRPWGRFLMRSGFCFVWLFLLILPAAIWCSGHTTYAFNDSSVTELVYNENRAAMHKITDTFAHSTSIALLVPAEDFEKEKLVIREVEALPEIRTATGLADIEVGDGYVLTDRFSPRMFSELMDVSAEEASLLFQAYGLRHEEYQAIFGNAENYQVPLVDMYLFLFDLMDRGVVTLDDARTEEVRDLRETLDMGLDQLRGEHWNRMAFTADVPVEGEESIALVETIRTIAEKQYGKGNVLVIGDVTSARDLHDSYTGDSRLISLLTISFVFMILLVTFRTVVGSAILVFVIQGSIWINFSFPYLEGSVPSFVTNMIVSAIQMGATIDYAIVLMNRYQVLKERLPKKKAMAEAVNQSFPTVLTSGAIMTIAGLLIAYRVSDVYVNHIGLAVGRGAFISVILVLSVLPQLLVLLDKAVDKTRFHIELTGGEGE
ncbi:MAG: MMPL family transporter [Oscillospiraceae bacterium]|nr:MMPL family transporter [Oscillospiraceae bacterium]